MAFVEVAGNADMRRWVKVKIADTFVTMCGRVDHGDQGAHMVNRPYDRRVATGRSTASNDRDREPSRITSSRSSDSEA